MVRLYRRNQPLPLSSTPASFFVSFVFFFTGFFPLVNSYVPGLGGTQTMTQSALEPRPLGNALTQPRGPYISLWSNCRQNFSKPNTTDNTIASFIRTEIKTFKTNTVFKLSGKVPRRKVVKQTSRLLQLTFVRSLIERQQIS